MDWLHHVQGMTVPIGKAARVKYDGAEARRIVLDAALHAFSNSGFEGTSTRAIAAAAGIEQGHLAYYYPSKMALWKQVIEVFARDGEARLRRDLPPEFEQDPVAAAKSALPAFLRSFAENPRLTRLMLQEFSVLSPRHEWVVENFGRPVWLLLRPLFEALHAEGKLSGAPPALAYFSLIGSALITFGNPNLVSQLGEEEPDLESWVDQAVEHMMKPILSPA